MTRIVLDKVVLAVNFSACASPVDSVMAEIDISS